MHLKAYSIWKYCKRATLKHKHNKLFISIVNSEKNIEMKSWKIRPLIVEKEAPLSLPLSPAWKAIQVIRRTREAQLLARIFMHVINVIKSLQRILTRLYNSLCSVIRCRREKVTSKRSQAFLSLLPTSRASPFLPKLLSTFSLSKRSCAHFSHFYPCSRKMFQ